MFKVNYLKLILYASAMAALIFILKWIEYRIIILDYAMEMYMGILALGFTGLGVWLTLRLTNKPALQVSTARQMPDGLALTNDRYTVVDANDNAMGISHRELEVLALMAEGLTNKQIAERLFVSLNTVKSHSSNLYIKLDVKRRTQAIDKGRKLGLVA